MKLFISIILLIIFAFFVDAELFINEVMYNPEGADNNNEYVEVYSELNLSGFVIQDLETEDTLELILWKGSNFSLIVEEEFNLSGIEANVYSIGKAIGNNLNNDRDIIVIKDLDGKILDVLSYSSRFGADNNGLSLCRLPDKTGVFNECSPSPGSENDKNKVYKIRINEIMPDPSGDDNAPMPGGEWIELYNYGNAAIDLDGFYFTDEFGHQLYITESNVLESTKIESDKFIVIYANGRSGLLNNEGFESLNLYNEGNLIDRISYGFSQESVSWALIDGEWLQSNPSPGDMNPENKDEININSMIDIENIFLGTDEKAKWGDNLRVKVNIYKGNTSKESVQSWVEKNDIVVSKRSRINVHKKFEVQEYTIPIQIHPNCKGRFKDDRYTLIISGLDTKAEKKFEIEGLTSSLCEQNKFAKVGDFNYEILDSPNQILPAEEFDVLVRLENNLNKKQKFKLWSYIVDGAEIISENDKDDFREIDLPGGSSAVVRLSNEMNLSKKGNYTLGVKILPDGKKTPKTITTDVSVLEDEVVVFETNLNTENEPEITGKVIFSSKTYKQGRIALYFLIFLIGVMGVYGLIRK